MRPGNARAWLRAGLAATLLLASACREPARDAAPKTEASRVVAARLVSCQSGKVLAEMPESRLKQLQSALARAEVSQDTALTTPAWESVPVRRTTC